MAERAEVFELAQLFVETTEGTPGAATKRVTGLMLEPDIEAEISSWRPSGYLFNTVTSLNKEHTTVDISGPITYTHLVYLLCSLMKSVTPTNGTPVSAKIWTFNISSTEPDAYQTYTIEIGSSVYADKFSNAVVNGLTLTFARESNELSGEMFAKAISTGITMTALTSAAEIALVPVQPTETIIKLADTMAGLTGASAITRGFAVEWSLTDRLGMVWPLNGTTTFAATVPTIPTCEVKLTLAGDAVGMGLLTNMRVGSTKFLRIEATGAVIGAGPATYSLIIDTALQINGSPTYDELDGVKTNEWTGTAVHNSTAGYATRIVVTNELAALA